MLSPLIADDCGLQLVNSYAPFKEAALMADLDGFGSHKSSVVSRPLLLDIDGCPRLSPYQHF